MKGFTLGLAVKNPCLFHEIPGLGNLTIFGKNGDFHSPGKPTIHTGAVQFHSWGLRRPEVRGMGRGGAWWEICTNMGALPHIGQT